MRMRPGHIYLTPSIVKPCLYMSLLLQPKDPTNLGGHVVDDRFLLGVSILSVAQIREQDIFGASSIRFLLVQFRGFVLRVDFMI